MARASIKALNRFSSLTQRAGLATASLDISPSTPIPPFSISAMASPASAPRKRIRHRQQLPASLMRAGTSRGLFIHQKYLPESQQEWKPWILAAMGSKNNDARQIDGVGGATSTTSKVCVVAPSQRPGIDVEYTFIQVAVGKESLDFSGNCGNMASGIGPFAVEEGLVKASPGDSHLDVSIYNTNTGKRLVETVELDEEGQYFDEGEYLMPGTKTPGSEVKVAFVDPAGSMTGKLFPTGRRREMLQVEVPRNGVQPFGVEVSYVDAANPFILVDGTTMPSALDCESPLYLDAVEDIRRHGAVQMGLAASVEAASLVKGTPKLAFITSGKAGLTGQPTSDVFVAAMSMQKPHPSLQLTGAVCIGAAACIPGTVVEQAAERTRKLAGMLTPDGSESPGSASDDESRSSVEIECREGQLVGVSKRKIRLAHGSGQIEVDVKLRAGLDGEVAIDSCGVSRTARKIFDGSVWVNF
jgi:2-methylaconitate cis-trans-isomerase PrpF